MKNLKSLKHVIVPLSSGGEIFILNTGAVIKPEAVAMLQALHSRTVGGIHEHLRTLSKKGAEEFMKTYYVGYGHKSIGDCGTTTVFIEGVSMLVAKAVQDWPLYSGQEASTRYINFAEQPFIDPIGTESSALILKSLRGLYLDTLGEIIPVLTERHPIKDGENENIYEKAIKARAFDITRSLLPSGAATNLAWHSNLRQIADKLMMIRHHPLAEVREVAEAIECGVSEMFSSSFDKEKRYAETEKYNEWLMMEGYYFTDPQSPDFEVLRDGIDRKMLEQYSEVMRRRPEKTELPKHIAECGDIQFGFLLDFGSFRDIQRHRAVTQRMPLVTTKHGFEQWYLNQLPDQLLSKVDKELTFLKNSTIDLGVSPEKSQYFTPMGYRLPNRLTGDLHALTYLTELRATRFVHPTLQIRAHQMADELRKRFGPVGLKIYTDDEIGRFDVKRGEHDIVKK